jgi:GH25 family lysozyme M1 (1,4-beta-N-acetylmuramidase)
MADIALDVSNNAPINRAQAKASGCKMLICKATEGTSFQDKTLADHRAIAQELGLKFGTYVFLHASSKGNQADYYLAYAKPRKGELVVIDAEPGGQDGVSIETMARRTQACAVDLEGHGHKPILYASSSYWLQLIAAEPDLKRLRVWEAQYPGKFSHWWPLLYRLRVRLRHGVTVVMWQFTDAYAVGEHHYDASLVLTNLAKL